jgi:lipopolysaccharide transport system ATP-binding protein
VRRGETIGIIGRNGSGKSTLLQMICGTLTPTSGAVSVGGRVAALLELGAGFNPDFTGRENVYLNASILGLSRSEIDASFDEIAEFAEIGTFIDQPVKTYSSGMYVRLAFAVVAHVKADILVIDEALAVGDAFFQQKCVRFLRHFKQTGTILFVSHDTSAVVNLCDRAIWLEGGVIRGEGPAKTVCEDYFAACYAEAAGPRSASATAQLPQVDAMPTEGSQLTQRSVQTMEGLQDDDGEAEAFIEPGGMLTFRPDAKSFGDSAASIMDVSLRNAAGTDLRHVKGGETVELLILARCHAEINRPILGFSVKDRLGQHLFGDNTYRAYAQHPLTLASGDAVEARFTFVLPQLASGQYSVTAAIASGTLEEHVQHHWVHDAMVFVVEAENFTGVLMGIPMKSIVLSPVVPSQPETAW